MDDLMTTDACTLPTIERPLRLAEFDELFAAHARTVTRGPARMRIELAGDPGLGARVRDLAERETGCCSFFTFSVEGDQDVVMEISVPADRRDLLDALAVRAEERCG